MCVCVCVCLHARASVQMGASSCSFGSILFSSFWRMRSAASVFMSSGSPAVPHRSPCSGRMGWDGMGRDEGSRRGTSHGHLTGACAEFPCQLEERGG